MKFKFLTRIAAAAALVVSLGTGIVLAQTPAPSPFIFEKFYAFINGQPTAANVGQPTDYVPLVRGLATYKTPANSFMLTVPNSQLLGGNGSALTSVSVGTGLQLVSSVLSTTLVGCGNSAALGSLLYGDGANGCTSDAARLFWNSTLHGLHIKGGDSSGYSVFVQSDYDVTATGTLKVGFNLLHQSGLIEAIDSSGNPSLLSLNQGKGTVGIGTDLATFSSAPAGATSSLVGTTGADTWAMQLGVSNAFRGGLRVNANSLYELRFYDVGLVERAKFSGDATVASFIPGSFSIGAGKTYQINGSQISCSDLSGGCGGSPGVAGSGLYSQVRSATPTAAGTGLTTSLNFGTATASDGLTGYNVCGPTNAGQIESKTKSVPATPYNIDIAVESTVFTVTAGFGPLIGWTNNTKYQGILVGTNSGGVGTLTVVDYATSGSGAAAAGTHGTLTGSGGPGTKWFRFSDDGTNVTIATLPAGDYSHPQTIYTVAKAAGYLGAGGYTKFFYGINANDGGLCATLTSYAER